MRCASAHESPKRAALRQVLRRQRVQRRTGRTASAGVCVSACSVALRKQVFPRFRSPALRRVGTDHCGFGSVSALAPRLPAAASRTCTDSAAASSSGVGAAGGKAGAVATGGGGDGSASGLMKAPVPDRNPRPCIAIAGARRRAPGNGACHKPARAPRAVDADTAQAAEIGARAERRASVGRERVPLHGAPSHVSPILSPRVRASVVPFQREQARATFAAAHAAPPKAVPQEEAALSPS